MGPTMDKNLLRVLRWGLGLLLISCVMLVGLGLYQVLWNVPELRRNQEQVVDALEVVSAARGLERAVQDAELGQRNIAITGDARYGEQYRAAVGRAHAQLADLVRLTSDDAEQHRRVLDLKQLVEARLAELKNMMEAGRPDSAAAILKLIRASVESPTMIAINERIDATVAAENEELRAGRRRAIDSERSARNTVVVANILVVAIMALGAFLMLYASRNIRRVERARRETEDQFRLLVGGVTDYAIFRLDPRGHVASWNAGAQRIKGYSAGEILGQDFSCFYTEEERKAGLPRRALEIAAREGRYEAEAERVRKDGSRFWANVVIDRLNDAAGRLAGFAKITRDITERRRQQQTLEQTRAELAQSQKMEALGQLTGGIAHDFNNLLTVIGSALDMMRRRQQDADPEMTRFIGAAARGVDRAASLTRRLLAFARRQPLDPRPLDVNDLVGGVIDMARRSVGEKVTMAANLTGGLLWVSADASQLENAILNLVVNARDAMPGGGKLVLETASVSLDQTYAATHSEVPAGRYVAITVSDTGRGMTEEIAARAFEPFFTTKEAGQGTGLGLSQVHGFVKQSKGHVSLYSEPGRGTTVRLYLPQLAGAPAAARTVTGRPAGAAAPGRMILVVEDDADVRAFTVETLSQLGHRVVAAPDAKGALEMLEREPVDLLFTDVGLAGGVNGEDLAEAAQRRWPALKVLLTTGYARSAILPDDRLEVITKPYTQTNLAERIQRLLDRGGTPPQPKDEDGSMKDDPRALRGS
jgi:PAS domain S-box-containing protein